MGLISRIKNIFRKGGVQLGLYKTLSQITDDERIATPVSEYERIARDKRYYADEFPQVEYKNSYGDDCKRKLRSLNIAKMAARRLASIIFNEQCDISLSDKKANDLITDVLTNEHFYLNFEEFLEKAIALGGGAARPYIQDDEIKIAWVDADQFYPLHTNTNEISEAAIASRSTRIMDKAVWYYTLLEFHEWKASQDEGTGAQANYQITYELYKSEDENTVGTQVSLNELDEYAGLEPHTGLVDVGHNLFAYFKTPGTNNVTLTSPLGLGIIDNSINIIHAINTTHDQFVWEVKMGKRRVAVPAQMLRAGKNFGSGTHDETHPLMFDSDQDVYEAMYGDEDMKITDLTTSIRNDQYQATMDYFLHEFENQVGLSAGTFTSSPDGVQTATEVVSNNSMTYQTRSSYLTQVEKFINDLVDAILELAKCGELFDDGKKRWDGDIDETDVNVHFDDGVFVDKDAQAKQDMLAVTSGVMPKKQFLMRNYGLSEEDADEWLAQVQSETPEPAPSVESSLFGGDGDGGDDNGHSSADDGQGSED